MVLGRRCTRLVEANDTVGLARHDSWTEEEEGRRVALATTARALEDRGLHVEVEPTIGGSRPDVIATVQNGPAYIIEVKVGGGPAHFSLIAQLLAFVESYKMARPATAVTAVLATTRDVARHVAEIAERSGVQVVTAPDVKSLGRELVHRIESVA